MCAVMCVVMCAVMCKYMYVCLRVCVRVYVHTLHTLHTQLSAHMYVCMCLCMCAYVYVHMYTHTHKHKHKHKHTHTHYLSFTKSNQPARAQTRCMLILFTSKKNQPLHQKKNQPARVELWSSLTKFFSKIFFSKKNQPARVELWSSLTKSSLSVSCGVGSELSRGVGASDASTTRTHLYGIHICMYS